MVASVSRGWLGSCAENAPRFADRVYTRLIVGSLDHAERRCDLVVFFADALAGFLPSIGISISFWQPLPCAVSCPSQPVRSRRRSGAALPSDQ